MPIEAILALIVIFCAVNASKSKQKKREAEKARQMPTAQQMTAQPQKPHHVQTNVKPTSQAFHAHTTVHAAKPKVHEHLAAECDLDAELQGSMAYDSSEGRDQCHENELRPVHEKRPEVPHETQQPGLKLNFSPDAMVQAMVMQEVLTRPCERKRR